MNKINKGLVALAFTAAFGAASSSVMAAPLYNEFLVNQSNSGVIQPTVSPIPAGAVLANKLIGNYDEFITFNATGTKFQSSIAWSLGTIVNATTTGSTSTTANASDHLFAYGQFNGNVSVSGTTTTFTSDGTGLGLQLFYANSPLAFSSIAPVTGANFFTSNLDGVATLIASGSNILGSGSESPVGNTGFGIGFSSLYSSFATTLANKYLIAPAPFYNVELNAGQFNNITVVPGGSAITNGSLDITFKTVPEPASLALVGAGLLGLGLLRRKQA